MATINDQEMFKEVLNYNPDSGEFTWKIDRTTRSKKGQVAGYLDENGYRHIRIGPKIYRAHRIAWEYMYGKFEGEVDHIDNNPSNNSISNLRVCNSRQNKYNARLRKDNSSGVKGLHWYKAYKKWQVNLRINGKTKCLGYFEDLFEACCTVMSARNLHHGEFANHGHH